MHFSIVRAELMQQIYLQLEKLYEEYLQNGFSVIKILLKNKGKSEHTFTVKKLGIDVVVESGKEKNITVKPKNTGTYELICRYHLLKGMEGKVIVK